MYVENKSLFKYITLRLAIVRILRVLQHSISILAYQPIDRNILFNDLDYSY